MIGRKLPAARAAKGLTKSPRKKSANVPPDSASWAIFCASSACAAAAAAGLSMDGLNAIARATPSTAAKTEVAAYHATTLPPTLPDCFRGRLAAPMMREKKMMGKTTILSMATMTSPNGATTGRTRASA